MKKGVKDVVAPQGHVRGPRPEVHRPGRRARRAPSWSTRCNRAKDFPGPVIVHVITHKGHGYAPAEKDEADRFHGVGVIDPRHRQAA